MYFTTPPSYVVEPKKNNMFPLLGRVYGKTCTHKIKLLKDAHFSTIRCVQECQDWRTLKKPF